MSKSIPSIAILEYLRDVLLQYNTYRFESGLTVFSLIGNPLAQLDMDNGLQVSPFLYSITSEDASRFSAQERLTYRIDILHVNLDMLEDAYMDMLAIAHDVRQAIMRLIHRDMGFPFEVTNLTHPSFRIVTNSTENPDLEYAYGQIEFSMDVAFDYYIDEDMPMVDGRNINWNFLIRNAQEQKS
ncbi:hypothetical protein PVA44_07730 (plasmid) [Entomospira nematocerorum]|uniref:Uncharacterized protein n=1 Tax=Entomospira nematocerorum TaxID=2719987 RepID=A0A968GEV9_9SPIO|nr:hypothetical protein [Entomospira nematocera]NIZ47802.1 hypothetical protein [Entomospira nematocera]WDI34780.1 hypothetical protein PVA44_07730 [Entomospira nematocera]